MIILLSIQQKTHYLKNSERVIENDTIIYKVDEYNGTL